MDCCGAQPDVGRDRTLRSQRYDLAIIGSGSAAFATAIAASRMGASVMMVEQGLVGGTCVNVGCIPSKALLVAAESRHVASVQRFPGITTTAGDVNMPALIAGKRSIVEMLRKDKYEDLAALYGFEILKGHGRFIDGDTLSVDGALVVAGHYVIASGSSPWTPAIPGLFEVGYLTSETAMELDRVPESLIVIGGNAVGLEQGQLFACLGSKVTIVEALPRIAPFEEPEVSDALVTILRDQGIDVETGVNVTRVTQKAAIEVEIDSPSGSRKLRAKALLVATGRRPNTSDLDLDKAGVGIGMRGEVIVDDELRTANPRIFAAGDVTGHPQFVYVAGKHGGIVAENALTNAHSKVDYRTLPRVTFTSPQVASVGMTGEQAARDAIACESRVLEFANVPRAIVNRDTRGIVKMVAERDSGRVLGIHLLADGAADAILAGIYALEANFTVDQIAGIWTPYLTMAEAIKLAAQSFSKDVAALSCCAV